MTLTLREGVGCRCDRERKEAPMERERAERAAGEAAAVAGEAAE